ncbi:MAG: YraN family protein [Cytophagales bacterium]|nr:YraN family protein [Cytophagales bacterium]
MNKTVGKTERGSIAEDLALGHLQAAGLRLIARNYKTPGRGGGEIDLIMQANDAERTLVFVEVRQRASSSHGGAAASVSALKQRRVIFAARHYLLRLPTTPPCRFDVVSVEGELAHAVDGSTAPHVIWIEGAFDAPSF